MMNHFRFFICIFLITQLNGLVFGYYIKKPDAQLFEDVKYKGIFILLFNLFQLKINFFFKFF